MISCVVVIPVYKVSPTASEVASFRQVLTVLNDADICLVTYDNLNLSIYNSISEKVGKSVRIEFFEKDFFKSVQGYNKLCLSSRFYERFISSEYMLIYQLDSWVFRNELQYWCEKGYDYIGAPGFYKGTSKTFFGVGNGGLSLRRIQYCNGLLNKNRNKPYIKPGFLWKMYFTNEIKLPKRQKSFKSLFNVVGKVTLKIFGFRNTLNYFIQSGKLNEDYVFGFYAPYAWNVKAKIPSFEEASLFCYEANPSHLYLMTEKLPFGCHAFEKWEFDIFWKKHIQFL